MPWRKFTKEEAAEMKVMHDAGVPVEAIADKFGCHHTSVLYWIGALNSKKPTFLGGTHGTYNPYKNSPKKIRGRDYLSYLKEDAKRRGKTFVRPKKQEIRGIW
jgi:hypothetical protein